MKAFLMDAYRSKDSIVLWLKTKTEDIRLEKGYRTNIYLDNSAEPFLRKHNITFFPTERKTYMQEWKKVLAVTISELSRFESFIRLIETKTRFRIPLYNADITPEQMFLYENRLKPCNLVIVENNILINEGEEQVPLKKLEIWMKHKDCITEMQVNGKTFSGDEKNILENFVKEFVQEDPDVVIIKYAFSALPFIAEHLRKHNLSCPFNRFDDFPIKYKGGRTYFSYGNVRYQDYAIRLHGRFLLDSSTMVGNECDIDGIVELCQLSGTCFQQVASRSFGAVFQSALVRNMVEENILVPYKEKPLDKPMSMFDLLKADRGGHTLDPQIGFHKNVAEIDFCSMYPWLIYNRNISADTILCEEGPFEKVPGIPVTVSMKYKGLVPRAIKPFLDRRMYYKKNPTALNKSKALGLKWVLVTSYGYLRFREFKLGIPSSHMAICAYARETLLEAMHLAEEKGFVVVHGIVDSLYIKKKKITEEEVKDFCKELQAITGIPVSFEGLFKWIIFLPSINDIERPVPARYYGAKFKEIKARGIEVRQKSAPLAVRFFQQKILEMMAECDTKKEIIENIPLYCKELSSFIKRLPEINPEALACNVRVGTTDYRHNIPQKKIIQQMKKKGIIVMPGQNISFIFQQGRVIMPEDYNGKPDISHYKKLLVRALYTLLQPFGISRESILEKSAIERQTKLNDFNAIRHIYVPVQIENKNRAGLSEKLIRKRLEKQGWEVWRGSLFNVVNEEDIYPNVMRKYSRLCELFEKYHPGKLQIMQYLCAVHHGMPDFVCFRYGKFKFVECKLCHEQLSKMQKKCIDTLAKMGFLVEVQKIVDKRTMMREADVIGRRKIVIEKQVRLTN